SPSPTKCSFFKEKHQPVEENVIINNGKYFIASNPHQVFISSRPLEFINNKQGRKKVNRINIYDTVKYKINDNERNIVTPLEALESFSLYIHQQIPSPEKLQYYESFDDDQGYLIIKNVPFALSPVKLSQKYIQLDDMSLQLVWDLQIEMENNWYHAHINANTGRLIALIDWVADATYNIFP